MDDDEEKPQHEDPNTNEKIQSVATKVAKPSPFPVIKFRIANKNHATIGREIISANINAIVLIESIKYNGQVSKDLAKQIIMDRMRCTSKEIVFCYSEENGV